MVTVIENRTGICLHHQEDCCNSNNNKTKSHQQSLNGHLHRLNLWFQLRPLLYGDRGSNDGAGHPAGPAQSLLGADKHIRDVLVLAEQRQVKDDLQWFSISGHHNKLSDASVEGLCGCGRSRAQ